MDEDLILVAMAADALCDRVFEMAPDVKRRLQESAPGGDDTYAALRTNLVRLRRVLVEADLGEEVYGDE